MEMSLTPYIHSTNTLLDNVGHVAPSSTFKLLVPTYSLATTTDMKANQAVDRIMPIRCQPLSRESTLSMEGLSAITEPATDFKGCHKREACMREVAELVFDSVCPLCAMKEIVSQSVYDYEKSRDARYWIIVFA
jgi:hypothetical protein